ncbi:AsmA-like C-terminal region-containing protein [Flavimarina sp. Hel_I_48]|uniref:AsmA-like C-terminal region-containing protein n=1 Tax=Flavimarina sp. Hel_I_48 TaxID=1392488 RepID=UPI0004DF8F72|nr:AsmA-like C-terminal region-containing protein [Flavimarina sp. Hel_I_48]
MKKALKIIGIVLGILILILILTPIIFKGQLESLVKKEINKNLNATVAWEDLSLSLFSSFPDAALTINDFSVINKEPFAGDTLASGKELRLQMGIPQLFKSSNGIKIDALALNDAFINIKVDSLGKANYDIAKVDTSTQTSPKPSAENTSTTPSEGIQFGVQHYEINNSRLNYLDESTNTFLRLKELNHEGNGDFSAVTSTLETKTNALVSFDFDGTNYLNNNSVQLDAAIAMNLDKMRFTFKDNKALVNQLPLVFEGFVQVNETNNEMDLTFKTPSSDFKNFLAVIPEEYAKNLDGVTTSGDFQVDGRINGIVDDENIPMLDIKVSSNNASFKYPDLPKTVENINIDAQLKNETGKLEDIYLNLGNLTFQIDQDRFAAKGRIERLTTNPLVDMALDGKLNLANLEKAYPLELEQDLNGLLSVNLTTTFDMESVEKEQFQNIKSQGTASLRDFKYTSPELPNAFLISETNLKFNTSTISLEKLNAKTGNTDISATGTLENLIPFMVSDQDLKGRFNVQSNTVDLADFSIAETEETQTTEEKTTKNAPKDQKTVENTPKTGEEAIKIPSFLDAGIDFAIGTVIYDNIKLSNVKGSILIVDETATLKNVTSDIFGGNIGLAGNVSTKGETPQFDMKIDLKKIDIDQSFAGLNLLKGLAPIAKALHGNLNTDFQLKGNLNNDLTPILNSLAGNAFAQLLTAKVDPKEMPLLSALDDKLTFIDLSDINLDNLKTTLSFDEGKIAVKPFNFDVKGINVNVSGSHNFDNTMNYTVGLDVPGKMLGSEIGSKLAGLSSTDLNNYKVEIPVSLTGNFSSPKVSVNTQGAISNLTQQIIASQKAKLQEKGEDKIKDALGNLLGGDKKEDAATTPPQTKKDSSQAEVKNAVKNVLGGLLNKKKKDTTGNN